MRMAEKVWRFVFEAAGKKFSRIMGSLACPRTLKTIPNAFKQPLTAAIHLVL